MHNLPYPHPIIKVIQPLQYPLPEQHYKEELLHIVIKEPFKARMPPNTAHIFTINPLSGKQLSQLFTTHPPAAKRIKRL